MNVVSTCTKQNKSAGISKQSMGARNRVGLGLSNRPARLHIQPGGIGSLESILRLIKSLKIGALRTTTGRRKGKERQKICWAFHNVFNMIYIISVSNIFFILYPNLKYPLFLTIAGLLSAFLQVT